MTFSLPLFCTTCCSLRLPSARYFSSGTGPVVHLLRLSPTGNKRRLLSDYYTAGVNSARHGNMSQKATSSGSETRHNSTYEFFDGCGESLQELLMPFTAQIAGHGSEGDGQRTFLKHKNGRLLKPYQGPPKGERESNFYKTINASEEPIDIELRKWIPEYFGIETVGYVNGVSTSDAYLVLEDVTEGFKLPNIMDIKIGSQTWGPDAPPAKQAQEATKYLGTKMPLGFSVLGIIIHHIKGESDEMTKFDKTFGKELRTDEVIKAPLTFFDVEHSGLIRELVEIVIDRMKDILNVYERQRKYLMYASSILFAYDAAGAREFLRHGDVRQLESSVNVRLIDFAHVWDAKGVPDENFLRGLRNLITVFQKVLDDSL